MKETAESKVATVADHVEAKSLLDQIIEQGALARSPEERIIERKRMIKIGPNGLIVDNYYALEVFAENTFKAGFAPKSFTSASQVFVAMAMGLELGFTPQQALRVIAVINGKPGIYGPAALALCQSRPQIFDVSRFKEEYEGSGDDYKAFTESARVGGQVARFEFSVADAKKAGLWGKPGPWVQYPKRMLKYRARGFNLADTFADILMGLKTVEELQDEVADPSGGTGATPETAVSDRAAARLQKLDKAKPNGAPVVIPNIDVLGPAKSPPDVVAAAKVQTPSAASLPDTGEKPPVHPKAAPVAHKAPEPDTVEDAEPVTDGDPINEPAPKAGPKFTPIDVNDEKRLVDAASETGLDLPDIYRQLDITGFLGGCCKEELSNDLLRIKALGLMARKLGPTVVKSDIEQDGDRFCVWTEVQLLAKIKELEAMPNRRGRPVGGGRPRAEVVEQSGLGKF